MKRYSLALLVVMTSFAVWAAEPQQVADTTIIAPLSSEQVAQNLLDQLNQGVMLGKQSRMFEAMRVLDQVIHQAQAHNEVIFERLTIEAMIQKVALLNVMGLAEESLKIHEQIFKNIQNQQDMYLQEALSRSMADQIMVLLKLDRKKQALTAADALIQRFDQHQDMVFEQRVAGALLIKTYILGELKQIEDALTTSHTLMARFGYRLEPFFELIAAKNLVNQSAVLAKNDRHLEALKIYDDFLQRYAQHPSFEIRSYAQDTRLNKAVSLQKLARYQEVDQILDPLLIELRADGLNMPLVLVENGKGFNLLLQAKQNWPDQTTVHTQLQQAQSLLQHAHANAPDEHQAMILGNLAYVEFLLGQTESAKNHLSVSLQKGGEEMYQGTLKDIALHPIAPDVAFKNLLDSLWQAQAATK